MSVDAILRKSAGALVRELDNVVDKTLPDKLAEIVKDHSKGAAIAGVAAGWVPGAGGVAAAVISGGFIRTMYGRINGEIELPISENVLKSLASGLATNLAAYVIGGIVMSTAFSLIPGLGNVGASVIAGGTCYALTLASGYVYMQLLTNLFRSGQNPSTMSLDALKRAAAAVVEAEDIKGVMKEAKAGYKSAKARGEFDNVDDGEDTRTNTPTKVKPVPMERCVKCGRSVPRSRTLYGDAGLECESCHDG